MKVLVVTNMYPTDKNPANGTFVKEQVESLEKEGVDIDVFRIDGSKHRINYIRAIFRLWVWLINHKYDLIHAHYVFCGIVARAQVRYPIVLTHHGLEVFTTWQRIPSAMITPLVDRAILVSEEQRRKLKCKNVEVIPCGIDMELFKPMPLEESRKKLSLSSEKKLVVWVGNPIRPEKRFEIVQKAIALAREKDPSIELILVAGKSHNEVPVYLNACDVLLLTSDAEGSPMVIKEAMSCNLPVVSVAVGDVPEVIGDTEGCYLCTQDPADVAEKLLLALNNPRRTSGRERIKSMESGLTARRIIALYGKVIRERNVSTLSLLASRLLRRGL